MSTLLDAALAYCRRGWSVIPLRFSGSVEDQKRPLLDSWEPYQREQASEEQIREWWAKWPMANIGLVMGAVSGLIAMDLDGPNAVALLHDAKVFLPRTAAVQTKRGYHAFYEHPGYAVSNRARLLTDGEHSAVDIRGDGGYVVAPPSVHGTGWVYQWVVKPEDGIAPLSPGLVALLSRGTHGTEEPADEGWYERVCEGVPEGQRDDVAARLVGYWLRVTSGHEEATSRAMRPWAMGCTPPFPDSEVRKVVRSIARRDAATRAHEVGKGLPRHQVIEGNQWAEELRVSPARQGVLVPVPGLIGLNGLVPGDLVVIAGRPGMGKSTWGCQLAVEACLRRQMPTWIVSTEMTRAQWGEWMAAIVAGKTTAGLPRPLTDDILSWFRQAPIAITDSGTMTIQELRSLAHGRLGVQLIIVDHLTRLSGTRKENRVLEVGEIARGLKALAKDLRCTVVALCQLNRRVEGDDSRKPRLADLRESGEIEQEADAVILLWTPERDIHQVLLPMHLSFAKNRHGPLAHYSVTFDKLGRKFVPSGERT